MLPVVIGVSVVAVTAILAKIFLPSLFANKKKSPPITLKDPTLKYSLKLVDKEVSTSLYNHLFHFKMFVLLIVRSYQLLNWFCFSLKELRGRSYLILKGQEISLLGLMFSNVHEGRPVLMASKLYYKELETHGEENLRQRWIIWVVHGGCSKR